MQIYDQHLHTSFSPDSTEEMEAYVKKAKKQGDTVFVTTEHLDFGANAANGGDIIPDFARLQETIKRLAEKYGIKMLLGIEAGYRARFHEEIASIVKTYPFDVVIASVHENDKYDFYGLEAKVGRTTQAMYAEYLGLVQGLVNDFKDYDILAHIDFPLRYVAPIDIAPFEDSIKAIFRVVAEDGKAFEINTRTVVSNGMPYLEKYAQWFLESGGKYFSLGSDAHRVGNYKGEFEETIQMLKRNGVNELSFYENRKRRGVLI